MIIHIKVVFLLKSLKTVSFFLTGVDVQDFKAANKKIGLKKKPSGYTWYHMDDLDSDLKSSLQLVIREVYEQTTQHMGSFY